MEAARLPLGPMEVLVYAPVKSADFIWGSKESAKDHYRVSRVSLFLDCDG